MGSYDDDVWDDLDDSLNEKEEDEMRDADEGCPGCEGLRFQIEALHRVELAPVRAKWQCATLT